jgi:hypothetical protein
VREKEGKMRTPKGENGEYAHPGILGPSYVQTLELDVLKVDQYRDSSGRGYQRPQDEKWIRYLANNWSEHACGVITVAARPNGTFWIVDGQQRVAALRRIGRTTVLCKVIPVNGRQDTEAFLFRELNNVHRIPPFNLYVADLKRGVPDAVLVDKVVKNLGYKIVPTGGGCAIRTTNCISKMRVWAKRNPAIFEKGMIVSAKIYRNETIDNRILNGLCTLEEYFEKLAEEQKLALETIVDPKNVDKLTRVSVNQHFQNMSKFVSVTTNNSAKAQANGFILTLNKKRRENTRIPFIP